ncbi:hypothetical protein MSG28_015958 [Choristoneura fumiferana]|uniref:Uncharacterized protein n=1 Tax=Choristoneura fumiferana TaxID=7141 RepID=A0ACC0K510_CHOFU|nr:hypothetical protein MSG28_015958 [Choristoneura fumiferana]
MTTQACDHSKVRRNDVRDINEKKCYPLLISCAPVVSKGATDSINNLEIAGYRYRKVKILKKGTQRGASKIPNIIALNKLKYTSDVTGASVRRVRPEPANSHLALARQHPEVSTCSSADWLWWSLARSLALSSTPRERRHRRARVQTWRRTQYCCAQACRREHAEETRLTDTLLIKGAGCTETLNQELARLKNNKIKVTSISPGSVSSKLPASTADDVVTDSDPSRC